MCDDLKISIITPSYNSGKFIERAIKSVLEQDYKNWEHIVMDGKSTDNTQEILKKYSHLNWVSEKDNGQADAMNKGFLKSSGDIIVCLNADDYFFPGAFSAVIEEFRKGAKFVVGNVLVKSPRLGAEFLNTPRITLAGMLRHWEPNAFSHNSIGYFYLREVQENCPFNPQNYAGMDLEFLLDASSRYTFSKIDFTLGCFEDGLKTKTGVTQSRFDYWKPSNLPYLEKFIKKLPPKERMKYENDRRDGYVLMQEHMNKLNEKKFELISSEKLPLISVIIPSYNCEKYICHAIDSVLAQNLKNLEILVIDDFSTDGTVKLLEQKYKNNSQVKVFIQEKNKKQGATRNKGLDEAKGKYIFFLDSDDWLEIGCLAHLASISEKYATEITACGVNKVWENGKKEFYHGYAFSCDDKNETLNYLADYRIGTIVWNKLYSKELIEKNKLRFAVPYEHEDVMFSIQAAFHCKNYISIATPYCNYFQRTTSLIHSKQQLLHLESYIKLYADMIAFFEKNKLGENEETENICRRLLKAHCSGEVYRQFVRYAKTHKKEDWEKNIWLACKNILGTPGFAIADFLIFSIENSDSNKKSTLKKFNQKAVTKKCAELVLASKLGPLARKTYYFLKDKKIIK
jgi:glycosyltransferase involved in cell wall biosynthesis